MRRILGAAIVCLGLVAAFALGISSCYTIPTPDCGFVCGAAAACPDGYTCATDNICHLIGTPSTLNCASDAGTDGVDAELVSPMVVMTTPASGSTNVPRTVVLSVQFDQAMMASSLSSSTFLVSSAGVPIDGTFATGDSITWTFTPDAELPANAVITVQLTANIDSALGAPLVPSSFTFTTLDDQPPTVASSVPLDMATGVPDASTIVVTFSEPVMNVDTTSFQVAAGVTAIGGAITNNGPIYTFTPSGALPAATLITVTLTGAITDLAGNALLQVSFSFTTQ